MKDFVADAGAALGNRSNGGALPGAMGGPAGETDGVGGGGEEGAEAHVGIGREA